MNLKCKKKLQKYSVPLEGAVTVVIRLEVEKERNLGRKQANLFNSC